MFRSIALALLAGMIFLVAASGTATADPVYVNGGPDLFVKSISVRNNKIQVVVINSGGAAAGKSTVRVVVASGSKVVFKQDQSVGSLSPGQEARLEFALASNSVPVPGRLPALASKLKITATADAKNQVAETFESNNVKTIQFP